MGSSPDSRDFLPFLDEEGDRKPMPDLLEGFCNALIVNNTIEYYDSFDLNADLAEIEIEDETKDKNKDETKAEAPPEVFDILSSTFETLLGQIGALAADSDVNCPEPPSTGPLSLFYCPKKDEPTS